MSAECCMCPADWQGECPGHVLTVAGAGWDGVYPAKPDPAVGMADTLPLVVWTDEQVMFVAEFIYQHRNAMLWQDPKRIREMLESAVKVR